MNIISFINRGSEMLAPRKKSYEKPRQHIKKQRHHFTNNSLCCQSYGFSSSHVQVWQLDHEEGWVPKNWCFQIVVLEKSLESSLDSKEIKPVNPKEKKSESESRSVLSNCLWPHEPYLTRLLCPWDFPGKNTGVDCHALLQGICPAQRSNPCLLTSPALANGVVDH